MDIRKGRLGVAGLMVLGSLVAVAWAAKEATPNADAPAADGIPIRFALGKPGYVTLVVEDGQGRRLRNLVADAYYRAGSHTVYWDGYDVGRAVGYTSRYASRGVGIRYDVERRRVAPGAYRVRGLVHEGIRMRYEMSVQSPGAPPWHTLDGSGAWLSDHTPPMDVLSLPDGSPYGRQPQVMVGARVAEAGHGFMFLDLDGRKLHGERLGWEGAFALARDGGPDADPAVLAYAVAVRKGTMTLFAHLRRGGRQALAEQPLGEAYDQEAGLDLAVYNQMAVVSLPLDGRLAFFDVRDGRARRAGMQPITAPRGLLADDDGRLYVIQDQAVKRYRVDWPQARLLHEEASIDAPLEDPRRLALDAGGTLYVSDWGRSHQVKAFAPNGRYLHAIGAPGGPQRGPYDERRMQHPNGIAVDGEGRLWVAEWDYAPKRLSQWTTQGALIRAFYGPPRYGGGGVLDPADSTRFYYAAGVQHDNAGIEFALDWQAGEARPRSIYKRNPNKGDEASLPFEAPVQPIRLAGRTYLVNTFNQASFGMRGVVGIWLWNEATRAVQLVSVVGFHGLTNRWTALDRPEIAAHQPPGRPLRKLFYVWSDLNGDGTVQADEMQYQASEQGPGRIYVGEDLAVLSSWLQRLDPPRIDANGVPRYDLGTWQKGPKIAAQGAGDVLPAGTDWVISAGGPLRGFYQGAPRWSYHSPHFRRGSAPYPPQDPGQLIETSRVLGLPVRPRRGQAGAVWALNGDKGSIYLFTADGLFLHELGGDVRVKPLLRLPEARRGQLIDGFSFDEEDFWPTLTQLASGAIVLAAGKEHTSLFRLEGFETVERRDFGTVTVSEAMLANLPAVRLETAPRQGEHR